MLLTTSCCSFSSVVVELEVPTVVHPPEPLKDKAAHLDQLADGWLLLDHLLLLLQGNLGIHG